MTVTEVGGDEFEEVVDRSGMGTNENAAWVNAPGESTSNASTDMLVPANHAELVQGHG